MELSVLKVHSPENFNGPSQGDVGSHREMAIDCPASFVGTKKEPPRYPRPLSVALQGQTTPSGTDDIGRTRKPADFHVTKEVDDDGSFPSDRQSRMKKYERDIQKRKEQEERMQREQEFLRTSLRGSKKLLELKEPPQLNGRPSPNARGFVNPNYISEEEQTMGKKNSAIGNHLEVEDIIASVRHIQKYLDDPEAREELGIISRFVLQERFQQLLAVHNKLVTLRLKGATFSSPLRAQEASEAILGGIATSDRHAARELASILSKSTFKNLMLTHDKIAKFGSDDPMRYAMSEAEEKEYLSKRASLYGGVGGGDGCIKIVRINKSSEPLGATVRNEGESVVIGRIVRGSMADQSGLLHEGDEILEINEVDVRGKTINDVSDFMSGLHGQLTFLIHPSSTFSTEKMPNESGLHLRALFNYDPDDDNYIPCRELGFSFMKGDVLHVIDTRDANWWQAYREGEDDQPLAGLIPSPNFQLQREELKQVILGDMKEKKRKKKKCQCVSKKKSLSGNTSFDFETKEYLTYEEVALYYPQPNKKRPVVLVGPKDVGRQELRQTIMKSDVERFGAAVPHTSRPQKPGEVNHQDYHFVSKEEFKEAVASGKFVEHGTFERHYFGTSVEAIREVVNSGKVCILNLYPQALKILKSSNLKPYFIFVAPPNIEGLRQLKTRQKENFNDDTLKSIIKESREIEDQYGHYFDHVIVITDIDRAFEDLLTTINQLEVQPQWVPTSWLT